MDLQFEKFQGFQKEEISLLPVPSFEFSNFLHLKSINSQPPDFQTSEVECLLHASTKIDQHRTLYFIDIVNRTDKLHEARTCSELSITHPSTTSGNHYLNPQGLVVSPSIQVYCDMTSKNGTGVTVIGHDSESRTLVNGSESAGSYKRNINYDISMEQIVAIVKQSKNCEQLIKYECYESMLLYNGYGWWVSRQGSKMNYWGGAAVNSGKCACGMANSCSGGGKCNCDKNDDTWREDSGYLRDKNTLPVKQLRFGDTGHLVESGYHTLGKLWCWD